MEQIIKNIKDADSYRKLAGYYDELIGKHYYNNLYNVLDDETRMNDSIQLKKSFLSTIYF